MRTSMTPRSMSSLMRWKRVFSFGTFSPEPTGRRMTSVFVSPGLLWIWRMTSRAERFSRGLQYQFIHSVIYNHILFDVAVFTDSMFDEYRHDSCSVAYVACRTGFVAYPTDGALGAV